MSSYDTIKCPSCLRDNDTDELESRTEYSCWSSDSVGVSCLHCDFYFEVACEHRGYEPACDSFDMNAFIRAHKVKVPDDISVTFVRHYLQVYIDGQGPIIVNSKDEKYDKMWTDAFSVAKNEWERIQHEKSQKDLEIE